MSQNDKNTRRPAPRTEETPDQVAERLLAQIPNAHKSAICIVASTDLVDLSQTKKVLELLRDGMEYFTRGRNKKKAAEAQQCLTLADILGVPACIIRRRRTGSLRAENPSYAMERLRAHMNAELNVGGLDHDTIKALVKNGFLRPGRLVDCAHDVHGLVDLLKVGDELRAAEVKGVFKAHEWLEGKISEMAVEGHLNDDQIDKLVQHKYLDGMAIGMAKTARQRFLAQQATPAPAQAPLARSIPEGGDLHDVATDVTVVTRPSVADMPAANTLAL